MLRRGGNRRHPTGEAINLRGQDAHDIDLGIIHYASDTPYTRAQTLGARGLSYYGMDSTYASTIAILRRIFTLESNGAAGTGKAGFNDGTSESRRLTEAGRAR